MKIAYEVNKNPNVWKTVWLWVLSQHSQKTAKVPASHMILFHRQDWSLEAYPSYMEKKHFSRNVGGPSLLI